jgi:hypothetical protein
VIVEVDKFKVSRVNWQTIDPMKRGRSSAKTGV